MIRWGRTGLVVAAVALAAAGCAKTGVNTAPLGTSAVNANPSATASAATAPPTTLSPVAHVGATIATSNGQDTANVTVTKIEDPAQPVQYLSPDPGARFVAVILTITSTTTGTMQGDAANDVTVIGSDNQTYTPNFEPVNGCTDFDNGSFTLTDGESTTGCVTFQVPDAVHVVKVRFAPDGGEIPGVTIGEWVNP